MTTFLFPGQGSQYIGMSKDFYDNFNNAKLVFDEVEDATSLPIKKIIFENSENQLNLTNFTQICIFTASYSIFKVIETEFDLSKLKVGFMLGHSLGEYTALVSSKKINLYECSKLLKIRGDLMNKSVEPNISGMAALIGLNNSAVQEIIDKEKLELQIANDNSLIQVVISGMNDRIESAKELFLNNGVKKFIKLNVSAAFHCNLMLNAQNTMKTYIRDTNFLKSDINIISNYSSKSSNKTEIIVSSDAINSKNVEPESDTGETKENIVYQIK